MQRLAFSLFTAIALLMTGGTALAEPPDAHQAISEFTSPEACAMCHPNAAQEVVESVHYQHQSIPKYRKDWPEGQPGGMYVTY